MMKKTRLSPKAVACLLAAAIAWIGMYPAVSPAKADRDPACINLEEADTWSYFGTDWSGCSGSVAAEGTKAVISADSFGWNGEWGLQYAVQNLGLSDRAVYRIEFDIVSTVDKKVFVKINDEGDGFFTATLDLKADESCHFREVVECGVWSEKQIIFGLGQMAGEEAGRAGVITLGNLSFTELGTDEKAEILEYDFSRVEENLANDFPDPGKAPAEGYDLVWADEFDGRYGSAPVDPETGLNLGNWSYQLGDGSTDCGNPGWGNGELQAYTRETGNIGVNEDLSGNGVPDGLLRITASREPDGYVYGTESPKKYTSARIRSTGPDRELFNTTYGYIEARISLPATRGAWPAFWMLPQSDRIYGGWPVSGELDIMETVGSFGNDVHNMACSTLHWGVPDHVYKGSGFTRLNSDITYFHTYGVDWKPGGITWYYDGEPVYTVSGWEGAKPGASGSLSFDAPFDQPFYLLLNLAVDSGRFGGTENKASFDGSISMYVDYVRVYQAKDGYAAFAEPAAGPGGSDGWQAYAGQNQIAGIAEIGKNMGDELSADKSIWFLSCNANGTGGAATATAEGGWAAVDITSAGSQDYSVQLIGHYDAKAGCVYRVSFDAYAEGGMAGKTVICDSKEWRSWSAYGIRSFALKEEPTAVSYTFMQNEDFENCRIEFNLGSRGTGTVHIGNVRVEIIDPSYLGSDGDSRAPLPNGNVIYNGSFDQGTHRTGYWQALDGTALTVPRCTAEALADTDIRVVDVASGIRCGDIADGVRYYERRAQISGESMPGIFQSGFRAPAGSYSLSFDMYCAGEIPVRAMIYAADEEGNLQKYIQGASVLYGAEDGVRHFEWNFELAEDIGNAALCLQFVTEEAVEVQVDNVFLINPALGKTVNAHPVGSETSWSGDNGSGGGHPLKNENGVYTATVSSGSTWYAPQFMSGTFEMAADVGYVLKADFRLEGPSNQTVKYIVQEAGGSWHVFTGPTAVTCDPAAADEDGFCHYEYRFTSNADMDNVHIIFGLGDSEASGAQFSFRNVTLEMAVAGSPGESSGRDDWTPLPSP